MHYLTILEEFRDNILIVKNLLPDVVIFIVPCIGWSNLDFVLQLHFPPCHKWQHLKHLGLLCHRQTRQVPQWRQPCLCHAVNVHWVLLTCTMILIRHTINLNKKKTSLFKNDTQIGKLCHHGMLLQSWWWVN